MSDKFSRHLNTNINYQQITMYPNILMIKQRHQNNRHYCSRKIEDPDEFRAREEKKEEEFTKQNTTNSDNTKSKEETENEAKMNAIRIKILEASMPFVVTHGWSRNAISHGAEQAGYPSVAHGIFPDGGIELIRYFYGKCNQELVDILMKETNNGELKIKDTTEFLVNSVKIRLQMIEPVINQWPQALAKMTLPQNVPKSLAQLLTLIDDICFFSGDKSVDFGWYSRRIGLATIYKMTEICMLQDKSLDHQATWEFLKNRMNEAKYLEEFIGTLGIDQQNASKQKLTASFETARNILGLRYDRQ